MISYPFAAGGLQTRILEAGEGSRSVLFIHGLGARADRWAGTLERHAARGYHCFALDLPGHGFAVKGGGLDYSVPGFARFVWAAVDALGIGELALVGTSLGGHIAASMTVRDPGRVRGLSMVGAVGLAPVSDVSRAAIRDNVGRTSLDAIRSKLAFVLADPAQISESWITEEWRINTSAGAAEAFAALGDYFFNRINDDAVVDALRPLRARLPMQLIWGALDRAVPLEVGAMASKLLDGLPLEQVPVAGHAPYFEQPEAFDACLDPFLAKLNWGD
jgi:2-hydroxy-6-oxonona-2,4-dienedioate hydrolase